MFDKLLYGKAGIPRIVGLEVKDSTVELFRLKEDFSIEKVVKPYRNWILSDSPDGKGWVPLEGNLHYRYGRQFEKREDFLKMRSIYKKIQKDVYSVYDARESAMLKDGYSYYLDLKPSDIPILSFDLETTGLDPNTPNAKILLISNTFRKNGQIARKLFAYDDYETEADMLLGWVDWVNQMDPCLMVGHNIFGFDWNYILHRAAAVGIEILLGRDGSPVHQEGYESDFRVDGSRDLHYRKIRCYGRESIDTLFLAYRYDIATKKYDSYGLKNIIKQEGIQKDGRVFYDASQIRFKYQIPEEWKVIKEYCEHDADDSLALFDLMAPAYFYMTQSIPRSFQQVTETATGAHINGVMVRAYLQDRHSLPKADQANKFLGALSDGFPGIYSNCVKWDVASLYPSIMRQFKVYEPSKDPKQYFLHLVEYFTIERLKNKKLAKTTGDKYYDDLQSSQKIFANSMYGFMGAPGLNFNSLEKAAFVTEKGREFLKVAIKWATGIDYEKRNISDTE